MSPAEMPPEDGDPRPEPKPVDPPPIIEPTPEPKPGRGKPKAEAPTEPEMEVPTELASVSRRRRLAASVRHTPNSWWCPNDDTSMPLDMEECPVDGFRRPDFGP